MRALSFSGLAILLFIAASGCSGSRMAATHPLEGEWSYLVDADGTDYEGVLSFSVVDGTLEGTIVDESGGGVSELENLDYDEGDLTFEFDSNEYGLLRANLEVNGNAFSGQLDVTSYSMMVPMTGERIDED